MQKLLEFQVAREYGIEQSMSASIEFGAAPAAAQLFDITWHRNLYEGEVRHMLLGYVMGTYVAEQVLQADAVSSAMPCADQPKPNSPEHCTNPSVTIWLEDDHGERITQVPLGTCAWIAWSICGYDQVHIVGDELSLGSSGDSASDGPLSSAIKVCLRETSEYEFVFTGPEGRSVRRRIEVPVGRTPPSPTPETPTVVAGATSTPVVVIATWTKTPTPTPEPSPTWTSPAPTETSTPTPPPPYPPPEVVLFEGFVTVSSTGGWTLVPVEVEEGQKVTVSYAKGTWTIDKERFLEVGPEGYDMSHEMYDEDLVRGCRILGELQQGRLIGRIGDGPPFDVAGTGSWRAETNGPLALTINDLEQCRGDNLGELLVLVSVAP